MMTNLFSTFDPATNMHTSLNWLSTASVLFFLPLSYWILPNNLTLFINSIINKLHSEFKTLLGSKNMGTTIFTLSLFIFILFNNMLGLLPYVFTSSSHMIYTLTLSLPLWLGLMIFGWFNQTNYMLAHLVPTGTPPLLMPFMVLIETISNIIRPGSLAVRLMANMIAGHLIMSLLGNNSINNPNMLPFIMLIQIGLMLFEAAVAFIQAYVFSVLSTLYASEV
uniref:ATP synthase subunit a n=1 Tax=Bannacoris arboreus TaxID=1837149 RepID=A0A2P1CLV4_9HEMI|nr:ATP synthase F0 subunit 6 [Bannacoris arboreus]AVJ52307.1 ATP synthase F0 subunit 6 [Bannacoris arboreus]WEM32391.1 ATP synthase F0 subunit 6 [Bannacoris arboreus]